MGVLANLENFIVKKVKSHDNFGKVITFSFKGEDRYTTFLGG